MSKQLLKTETHGRRRHGPLLLLACLLGFGAGNAQGLGFRIPNLDAEATARGNAFVATADNPAALAYNPAGITQLEGQNAQFGAHLISANSDYHSAAGVKAETKFEVQPVPQFYYTYTPPKSALSFGVGMFAPFGLGLEWPQNTMFRTLAIEGRLAYLTLTPVAAWKPHETLSLAIGPTINYAQIKIRQGVANAAPNTDEFKFKGDDYDFGFSAGVLWQPHPRWSFGASYRSATTIAFAGTASYNVTGAAAHTTASTDFPQVVIGGISFRPTPKWNIEANVDWTDWDTLKTVTFKGTRNIFGADYNFALNWESSFLYELGVTRYLSKGYFVSGGYFFSQNSISERYFNPIVPDTDLHVGSLGFGNRGKHWRWAVSGQIITGPSRTVSTPLTSAIAQTPNGKYHWFNQAVNLSVGYHF